MTEGAFRLDWSRIMSQQGACRRRSASARSGEDLDEAALPPEFHPVIVRIGGGDVASVLVVPAGRQIDPTADVSLFIEKIQVIVRHSSPPRATQDLDPDDIMRFWRAPFSETLHNRLCDINFP